MSDDRRRTAWSLVLLLLTGAALFQAMGLAMGSGGPGTGDAPPAEGAKRGWALLGSTRGGVVLSFHPQCAHAAQIAPQWAPWIASLHRDGVPTVGVTRAEAAAAATYVAQEGWSIRVEGVESGSPLAPMAGRTPWIYVFAPGGELAFQGHGSRWAEAARIIEALGLTDQTATDRTEAHHHTTHGRVG